MSSINYYLVFTNVHTNYSLQIDLLLERQYIVNAVDVVCVGLQHFQSVQSSSSSHSSLSRTSPITVETGSLPDFEVIITLRESLV